MDSSDSISLLNQLILPNVELRGYYNPREYLTWLLEKSYNFFTPVEQLDFTSIQYYSFDNHSPKELINSRLVGTPCFFNTRELTKDRLLQLWYDMLAFGGDIETIIFCINHQEGQINYSSISTIFLMFRWI